MRSLLELSTTTYCWMWPYMFSVLQEGRTALIKACNNGRRLEAVRALLAAGADVKAKDRVGGD